MIPTAIKSPAHADTAEAPAHVGANHGAGEEITHASRETSFEYTSHHVCLVSIQCLIMQRGVRLGDRSSEGAGKAELLLRRCAGSLV